MGASCGGGGSYRTGKWRPLELFRGEKRNCNLSHERIGAICSIYETRPAHEVTPTDLSAMLAIYIDGQLRFRASSKEMEASFEFPTYESIVAQSAISQAELERFIGTTPAPGVERLTLFHWEAGKLKARKGKKDSAPASSPSSPAPRRLHGFFNVQVNYTKGIVFLSYSYLGISTPAVWSGIFRSIMAFTTALHDANFPTLPLPTHFCAPLYRIPPDAPVEKQHTHPSKWGGFGFVHVDDYVRGLGIDPRIFDEPGVLDPSLTPKVENFVVATHELREWCDSVDEKA
ncbi:hypothetical protein BDK51DRAFT_49992 [Blyttiomyces helicus]|uniref:Uncharacterized protein n=1 Tax=Blyttiomyces helicus TaxID=388810 RepID=A0A4P9VT90_9FUNG|nr:hypothetical protein BDK51DRAFT_49992 [Blyttiomyces helicus]|eukprot:RKO82719.1 hypothetical protein BDK51DRAFT_49992 [Blyttiomyces helicus]